jgi:hypothetical protein
MNALVLRILVVAPAVSFATLLPGLDPVARIVVSATAGLVILGMVAELMLAARLWSPGGGLAAVAVICGLLVTVSFAVRRR